MLKKTYRSAVILVAVIALSVFLFLSVYYYDNKYTAEQPQASAGVLMLDEGALDTFPVLYLIGGWEYYGGRLLSPEDFANDAPSPDKYIYIGQYGGFDAGDKKTPPHGSATYRLSIFVPDLPREFMLELPEVFSAFRSYVNGNEILRMGNPDPAFYRPETGNRLVTFEAGHRVEIIISVTDFSSFYSGMTYPPAFGEPESVANLLSSRLLIRGVVCAVALTVALISLLIKLTSRSSRLTVLYGLLCIFFIGYVSYPIVHTYIRGFGVFYIIESFSFCAMLLLTMFLQYKVFDLKDKWSRYFMFFGILCCAAVLALPLIVSLGNTVVLYGYSRLISAYQWIAAAYITFVTLRAFVRKAVPGLVLLCGILVFDCALVMDRLFPLFEPIYTGWFVEIASFALVITLGAVIGLEVAAKYRENAILSERASSMERLTEMQQGYFTVLKKEMDETKSIRHDLHHHFMVIESFLNNKQYDDLTAYITNYNGLIRTNDEPEVYTDNNVINILIHHYQMLSEQNRILLDVRCELTEPVSVSDADLCGILSNLLENAVEACLRIKTGRRNIHLGFMNMGDDLVIRVENTTDGSLRQSGKTFLSSKGEERIGYGITSVLAVAKRNGGVAGFTWNKEARLFTAVVVLQQTG